MVGPSSPLGTFHPLQAFSSKSPSSNISSMKIKTVLHTLIISHVCRLIRALAKAKSVIIHTFKTKNQPIHFIYPTRKSKKTKKIFFGSFRLHYNWCSSSHVMPVPAPVLDYTYYDPSWDSIISTEQHKGEDSNEAQLAGYLQWLEEEKKVIHADPTAEQQDMNEIDRLAEIFIANCHEKFILEKQESYRRFQEMLVRSM